MHNFNYFFITTLVFVSATQAIPSHFAPRAETCEELGFQCTTNCSLIILCPDTGKDPMSIATCPEKKFCQIEDGGLPSCSASSCGTPEFRCTLAGRVPNPTNSSSFYLCGGPRATGILMECAEGQHFDTTKDDCDPKVIPNMPVICTAPGQFGLIGADDKFCYACDDQLIPVVYLCSLGTSDSIFLDLN